MASDLFGQSALRVFTLEYPRLNSTFDVLCYYGFLNNLISMLFSVYTYTAPKQLMGIKALLSNIYQVLRFLSS